MSAHVIGHPIGEPAGLNTSRTFPSARAAGREAAAWNADGRRGMRTASGDYPDIGYVFLRGGWHGGRDACLVTEAEELREHKGRSR